MTFSRLCTFAARLPIIQGAIRCVANPQQLLGMATLAASLSFASVNAAAADSYSAIKQALATGEPARALTLLQKAKAEHPKDVQLMFFEGVIKAQMGETRAAIAVFEDMADKYPELPEPHNNLGVLYAAKGDLEKAKAAFERAILTNPAYAAAHKNMSDVYAALAKQNYGKALQVDAANAPKAPQMTLLGNLTPGAKAKDAVLIAMSKSEQRPETKAEPSADAKPEVKPAAPTQSLPDQPSSNQLVKDVEKSVMAWASAWSKRDIEGYLGAYSQDFDSGRMSLSAWKQQRTDRILPRKRINVDISKLTVSVTGSQATADFEQDYSSDTFNGSSSKRLSLALEDGRWLIVKESVR